MHIFASTWSSLEARFGSQQRHILKGTKVIAARAVKQRKEDEAARELAREAARIGMVKLGDGAVLRASEDAEVYKMADSEEVIGEVQNGNKCVAAGPPVAVDDCLMVPIKPQGAVMSWCFHVDTFATSAPPNVDAVISSMSLADMGRALTSYASRLDDDGSVRRLLQQVLQEAAEHHPTKVQKAIGEASEESRLLMSRMHWANIRMRSAGLDRRALPNDVKKLIRAML